MQIKTCETRAELEAQRELQGRPGDDRWAQVSVRYYIGRLAAGESRSEPTAGTMFAAVMTDKGEHIGEDEIEEARTAAMEAIAKKGRECEADIFVSERTLDKAVELGVRFEDAVHQVVVPLTVTKPWLPPGQQAPVIARHPVRLMPSPTGLAVAHALTWSSHWTATDEEGPWPTAELVGIEWVNVDGQIGAAAPEETRHAQRRVPIRVESMRLLVRVDGTTMTLRSNLFIDDHLRMSTTDAMAGENALVYSYMQAAARSAGRAAEMDDDSAMATALAHTKTCSAAYSMYLSHVRERYIDQQMDIIAEQSSGRPPETVWFEFNPRDRAMRETAAALSEAIDRTMDPKADGTDREDVETQLARLLDLVGRDRPTR